MRDSKSTRFAFLLAVSAFAGSCQPAPDALADVGAGMAEGQQTPAASDAGAPSLLLTFELPDEFRRPAGAPGSVTGFRIGYFLPGSPVAIRTFDVSRESLSIEDRTVRVRLPADDVPEGAEVRVQTLSDLGGSRWSRPVALPGPHGSPVAGSRNAADRNRARTGLTAAALEPYPQVADMLREALPEGSSLEEEAARFLEIEDLVMALLISRDHGIPLTTISRMVEGPPRLRVRDAVRRLRPDLPGSVTRRASAEAARLVAAQ